MPKTSLVSQRITKFTSNELLDLIRREYGMVEDISITWEYTIDRAGELIVKNLTVVENLA